MTHAARPFPSALPHGPLRELLPGLHLVTGTVNMPGWMTCSRNMTVVQQGERVILVNTVRLDDAGLAKLDALGKVTDIIRLAGNHGMDDPFYAHRYGAKVWNVPGQRYTAGLNTSRPDVYFSGAAEMTPGTALPLADAQLCTLDGNPPEGLLLLKRDGGVLISGDCLQNWAAPDGFFNTPARLFMPLMGFMKAHNVGPAWLMRTRPPKTQLRALLDLTFDKVLPAHGAPVMENAKALYRPALERVSA